MFGSWCLAPDKLWGGGWGLPRSGASSQGGGTESQQSCETKEGASGLSWLTAPPAKSLAAPDVGAHEPSPSQRQVPELPQTSPWD